MTRKRELNRALEKLKDYLTNTTPSQNLHIMRSKMPSTASKKGEQKTAAEFELNNSKIAVTVRKKKSR